MLEPTQSVELEETLDIAQDLEGAGGDRDVLGGVRAVAGGAGRPDPELAKRAKRRSFTAAYELKILGQAAAAYQAG